uniref:hypothetical protein n=1 Tax=Neorhizobium sp. EC2-8 TaxID=3129230 RepID=UPI003101063A
MLYVANLPVGTEHYAYAMKCKAVGTETGDGVRWAQSTPLTWVAIDEVGSDEAQFNRFRSQLAKASGAKLVLSATLEAEEIADDLSSVSPVNNSSPIPSLGR